MTRTATVAGRRYTRKITIGIASVRTERVMTVAETFSAEQFEKLANGFGPFSPQVFKNAMLYAASLAREVETLRAKLAEAMTSLRKDVAEEVNLEQENYDLKATIERLTAEVETLKAEGYRQALEDVKREIGKHLYTNTKNGHRAAMFNIVERLMAENQRLKDDCGKPLTEGE
jgi:acetyl-CoA carboxylase alpha subunit